MLAAPRHAAAWSGESGGTQNCVMEGAPAWVPDEAAQADAAREERAARLAAGLPGGDAPANPSDDLYVRMDDAPEEDEDEEYISENDDGIVFLEDGPDDAPPPDDDGSDGDMMEEEEEEEEGDGEAAMGGAEELSDMAVFTFSEHKDPVYSVATSPVQADGMPALIASGAGDDLAYLWSNDPQVPPRKLEGHADSVSSCSFSNDGKYVATCGLEGVVKIWDVSTASHVADLEGPGDSVDWGCWHPKGPVFLAGSSDSTVWMWNAPKAACMMVFSGHADAVTCGGFTPDGKKVYTGSADCTVKLWNPKTGAATTTFGKGDQGETFQSAVTSVSAAKGAPMLLSGAVDGKLLLLHRQTGKVVGRLEHHKDSVETVAFAHDPAMGASGSMDNDVAIWDLNTLRLRVTCRHDEGVNHILWHPSEPQLFLTGSIDGIVRLWDCRTGEEVRKWTGHRDCCLSLALTADGKHVVTGSDDATAKMFSLV